MARLVRPSEVASDQEALEAFRWIESRWLEGKPLSMKFHESEEETWSSIYAKEIGLARSAPGHDLAKHILGLRNYGARNHG